MLLANCFVAIVFANVTFRSLDFTHILSIDHIDIDYTQSINGEQEEINDTKHTQQFDLINIQM